MENLILKFEEVNGKNKKFNLKNINFELNPGFIYCITGKNGAGKTTMLKCIMDEYANYTGNIYFDGVNIRGKHADIMQSIGFISEEQEFFNERTCAQNVEILSKLYESFNVNEFENFMKKMHLSPQFTYKKMSRGEKLKFQLAFSFSHSSRLYIMDEATAGMDPVFRIEFFDILRDIMRDGNSTVLMTSHNMDEIRKQTDYYAVMEGGKLGQFKCGGDI